jgi:type IV pilus assembly protein PilM
MGFGIDIGAGAIKVARVQRTLRGFRVVGAARRRMPSGTDARGSARALRELLAATQPGPGVVGLGGRDINLQVVQQPSMPPANYRAMMGYELEQRRGAEGALYGEYATLREPDPYNPGYLAMAGIAKREYVDDRIALAEGAGVDVRDAVPTPFALFAAYRNAYGVENGTLMLLDIGAETTDLVLVRGGRLLFCRNVATGSRVFDNGIAGLASVTRDEAEARKIRFGNLGPTGEGADPREEEIRPAVRAGAGQLAGAIQSSIGFARTQLGEKDLTVDKIYISGGGARLLGLPGYLQSSMKIPVEPLDPFRNVDLPAFEAAEELKSLPTDMTAALGLAEILADPGSCGEVLSILPDRLKARRNFFRGPAYLVAAGVLMAVGVIAVTVVAVIRRGAAESARSSFQQNNKEVQDRIQKVNDYEASIRTLLAKRGMLESQVTPGRGLLDAILKMRKILPDGVHVRSVRLVNLAEVMTNLTPPERIVFSPPGKGILVGVIPPRKATAGPAQGEVAVRIIEAGSRGETEKFPPDALSGAVKIDAPWLGVQIEGEIDDQIKGTPSVVLDDLKLQLADPSRGVVTELHQEGASSRPGWQLFKIVLRFE